MSNDVNDFHVTRETVKETFDNHESSGPYPKWKQFVYETTAGVTRAKIQGEFTLDELLAIAWCMKNKVPNYCRGI